MHTRIVIDNYDTKSIVTYESTNITYPICEIKNDKIYINKRTNKQIISLVSDFISLLGESLKRANLT